MVLAAAGAYPLRAFFALLGSLTPVVLFQALCVLPVLLGLIGPAAYAATAS
jgi:hypothetical protein